jgi:hypothetical protein
MALDLYDLDEVHAARGLARDTLDRMRRVLGDDHPDTLRSGHNLPTHLHPGRSG